MSYSLSKLDIAIVNALQEDGRKSFRQISRELKISTPTIKFHYQRLVNIGLIKSISPIIDTNILDYNSKLKIEERHCETKVPNVNLSTDVSVKMICDYCDGPIGVKPSIFKFAKIERFFCCTSCKSLYKEKYKGRIESLIRKS